MSADVIARGLARQASSRIASTANGEGAALVGFRHSAGSAVARTAHDKLREAVSVRDFGAVGDGSADDTAAIQAALDATLTASGGALYFPRGTYNISAKLVVPFATGWRIFGESRAASIIRQTANNTRILSVESDLTHSWEIAELGFTWATQQSSANTGAVAIFLGTGSASGGGFFNWQVRRCTFGNGFRAIASAPTSSSPLWCAKVSECTHQGTMTGAFFRAVPSPAVGQPNITLHNNLIDAASLSESGIAISAGDNIELSRNEFIGGAASSNSSTLMQISSTARLQLIGNKSEAYAFGAFNPNLFDFPQSNVMAIGNSFNGFTGTANPKLLSGSAGGKLTIVGLTIASSMTAGNAVAYTAGSIGLVCDVTIAGPFVTDNARSILGLVPMPRFDADRRQPDWATDNGDAAVTLNSASDRIQYFAVTLTANRTIVLPNSGVYEGMEFEIVRRAATPGAFSLSVSDPLSGVNHTIPANTNGYVRYRCRGGSWRIMAAGTF